MSETVLNPTHELPKPTALASVSGCAAPSEIQAVIRELNQHIENLERLNRIGVSSSICDAIRQRQKLVAALCGEQHNDRVSESARE